MGFALAVGASLVTAVIIFFWKRIWAWKRTVWRRWSEYRHPERLAPPSREQLEKELEENAWGARRYRATSTWNPTERRAYLSLRRRDKEAQSFRAKVIEPTGAERLTNTFGMENDFICLFPDDFQDAPRETAAGDYEVIWYALLQSGSGPVFREVDRGSFRVP